MDIRDYEYIVKIAELGGITKAAAQLFITQPALTRFLQRTEERLGLKLFVRQGHRFILTEAGRAYVETGRSIMQLDQELAVQMEYVASTQRNQIRFSCGMGRGDYIFSDVLPEFYKKHPEIEVRMLLETSRRQMQDLADDKLDMSLVTSIEEQPGYRYIPLGASYLTLVVSENNPILQRAKQREGFPYPVISMPDLEGQDFLALDPNTRSGGLAAQIVKMFPFKPHIKLILSESRGLIDLVENGLGVAILLSVPNRTKKIRFLCLEEVGIIEETVNLVLKQDKTVSPALQYLIDLICRVPN